MNSDFSHDRIEAEFRQIVRQRLATRRDRTTDVSTRRYRRWAKQLSVALLNFCTGRQTISVQQKPANSAGEWVVYDPQSGHRRIFYSEQAVRTWLEQKHL